MDALRPEFNDRVAFVVADLNTLEGQAFSTRFGIPETTLVFFDASGRQLDTLQGLQSQADLRNYIADVFGFKGGASARRAQQQRDLEQIMNQYDETARRAIERINR